MPDELMTPDEAIAYLGLDRQGLRMPRESLRWLCRTGRLRFTRVGRYIRFRRSWLDELIERNAVQRQVPPAP
jgi:excisionase family DNA binding protein